MFGAMKKPISLLVENSNETDSSVQKKTPIWKFFTISEADKSRAICNSCGKQYSLGSDKPKYQITTNLKSHLKSKHYNEYLSMNNIIEKLQSKKRERVRLRVWCLAECRIFFKHPALASTEAKKADQVDPWT